MARIRNGSRIRFINFSAWKEYGTGVVIPIPEEDLPWSGYLVKLDNPDDRSVLFNVPGCVFCHDNGNIKVIEAPKAKPTTTNLLAVATNNPAVQVYVNDNPRREIPAWLYKHGLSTRSPRIRRIFQDKTDGTTVHVGYRIGRFNFVLYREYEAPV